MNGGVHASVEDTEDRDVVDETAVRPPRECTGIGTGAGDRRDSK